MIVTALIPSADFAGSHSSGKKRRWLAKSGSSALGNRSGWPSVTSPINPKQPFSSADYDTTGGLTYYFDQYHLSRVGGVHQRLAVWRPALPAL
jgi:hypothetical protein